MAQCQHWEVSLLPPEVRKVPERLDHGCGAGTEISGSGRLHFLPPAPTSKSFWLRLQNNLVQKVRKKRVIYITTCFTHKLSPWNRNPNFRLRLHHLKVFGSGSSHPKLLGLRLHNPGLEVQWNLYGQLFLTNHIHEILPTSGMSRMKPNPHNCQTNEQTSRLMEYQYSCQCCLCKVRMVLKWVLPMLREFESCVFCISVALNIDLFIRIWFINALVKQIPIFRITVIASAVRCLHCTLYFAILPAQ